MNNYICGLIVFIFMLMAESALGNANAVILQYHHVSDSTPVSTSVTPDQFKSHLNWLRENKFEVLPLPTVVEVLTNRKRFSSDKVVAITFDDANISVCEVAWPVLKKYKTPFTLFISTEVIEKKFKSQCSWDMLRDMVESGLMTAANHSHRHLNMVSSELLKKPEYWHEIVIDEIESAQRLITSSLSTKERLFAYPYGEYNSDLEAIVEELGYTGFGQHSGAVGYESDFSALPRFPVSGQYADLETLSVKLNTLPFPVQISYVAENPIQFNSVENPPVLEFEQLPEVIKSGLACYNSEGRPLPLTVESGNIQVKAADHLSKGRHRYTCTSPSDQQGRYYWISHQWLVE